MTSESGGEAKTESSGWGYYVDLDTRTPAIVVQQSFAVSPSSVVEPQGRFRQPTFSGCSEGTTKDEGAARPAAAATGRRWGGWPWLSQWPSLRHCYCSADTDVHSRRRSLPAPLSNAVRTKSPAPASRSSESLSHLGGRNSADRDDSSQNDGWY